MEFNNEKDDNLGSVAEVIILLGRKGAWGQHRLVLAKSITGKKALIELCGTESSISKEGFRIDQWMF